MFSAKSGHDNLLEVGTLGLDDSGGLRAAEGELYAIVVRLVVQIKVGLGCQMHLFRPTGVDQGKEGSLEIVVGGGKGAVCEVAVRFGVGSCGQGDVNGSVRGCVIAGSEHIGEPSKVKKTYGDNERGKIAGIVAVVPNGIRWAVFTGDLYLT